MNLQEIMVTMGININSKAIDFVGLILAKEKMVETRNTRSLRPYVGKRVGIIRTGCGRAALVGYATITEEIFYDTVENFRKDEHRHCVPSGSKFDCTSKGKYGYVLADVVAIDPVPVYTRGIIARKIS